MLKVALIAHDKKKLDLAMFVKEWKEVFEKCELFATRTTGKIIEEKIGLKVNKLESGPYGGDLQIGALIVNGEIDFVVFLRDPLTAQPHEPDVSALLRVCDVHNIPLATNLSTAEGLVLEIKRKLEGG
ncbi:MULTISPECIES: methylglyoxal synthase [unclassified Thermosipho (in: thermotogales)]|uniref:methylglyoxal synthase n=1 Tax=unclassified Thermosipho (in: thermotogales) TaxID=2676525 RepID=UPI000949251F|nr:MULTISPECIES: methylglyoxal synthase [unclassified Thermosipho (in: thermotogales)]ANQ53986.1 methylglyoxal synthase [Thermosipho sp. 1070]APT72431.1 methylglyoxal synthase [Thermosipho sp. 1063]MBT1248127.1 methylglyoxal synthase [Thermosipho sp. 1244]OOC42771.1 methylglyoxal synthase [Thermosipho sp. 1074]OOC46534.1 methylglyoxal synthase [Thermosipho sp. 1223]